LDLFEKGHACRLKLFSFISAKFQAWGPHEFIVDIAVTLEHFGNVWFWQLPNTICIISHMFLKSV
jgi:hypothetical protein